MYCPYIHANMQINSYGKIRPCCRFDGFIENDQSELNLKDMFYGDNMTSLRTDFSLIEKDAYVDSCFRCYNEEKLRTKSLRQKYPFKVEGTRLEVVELSFSNVCNFKCRTCASATSTSWQSDDEFLSHNGFSERSPRPFSQLGKIVYDGIDSIRHVKITGGEPFLYKRIEENLHNIVENNRECSICIYTNGSIFPSDNIIKTLKRFKSVYIAISIDGFGPVNEYIRHGSIWSETEENVKKWRETGFIIRIVSVVSAYSLPRFKELLDWWKDGQSIFIYLQNPPYIDINVLPEEVLNKAVTDLAPYDLPFMPVIKNTKKKDDTQFKLYTRILDELRGQDYEKIGQSKTK